MTLCCYVWHGLGARNDKRVVRFAPSPPPRLSSRARAPLRAGKPTALVLLMKSAGHGAWLAGGAGTGSVLGDCRAPGLRWWRAWWDLYRLKKSSCSPSPHPASRQTALGLPMKSAGLGVWRPRQVTESDRGGQPAGWIRVFPTTQSTDRLNPYRNQEAARIPIGCSSQPFD